MADGERDPQVLISVRIDGSEKIVHLPSDRARWGWIIVLGRAKLRRPAGEFPSRAVLAHDLGWHARFIPDYLKAGLLEDHDGRLVVHDWQKHQGRRSEIPVPGRERTAKWRRERDGDVTPSTSQSDATVTQPSRARASALSPSLSLSPETSPRNGTAVPAPEDEPEAPAIAYLASVGAHVPPNGNGIHRKLIELVRRRGLDRVLATLEELHEQDFAASGRQLVFAAENALDRPARPAPVTPRKGYHAQEDPDVVFGRR